MSVTTARQAAELLARQPGDYGSVEALHALAAQLSVAVEGKPTFLYTGLLDAHRCSELIKQMVDAGHPVRVLDKTEAARFLCSKVFRCHLAKLLNATESDLCTPGTPAFEHLYALTGFWAVAATRFVQASEGDFLTFTPQASGQGIYAQLELPSVILNDKAVHINNVSVQDLRRLVSDVAREGKDPGKVIFEYINAQSRLVMSDILVGEMS